MERSDARSDLPPAPVQHPGAYPSAPPPPAPPSRRSATPASSSPSAPSSPSWSSAAGSPSFGPFRSTSSIDANAAALRSAQSSTAVGQVPADLEVPTTADRRRRPAGRRRRRPRRLERPEPERQHRWRPRPAAPAPSAPSAPAAPAPVITSFATPENIDCHNGDFQTFSASWTTTNATKTTISIDGPGVYKTYAANDSDSLPFNCSSPHTFLLTAYGHDGSSVTQSITLQPRNVQVPDNGQDDDADPSSSPAPAPDSDDEI